MQLPRAGAAGLVGQLSKWDNVSQGHHPQHDLRSRLSALQERQRLETILSLCAEYNHEDSGVGLAEVVRNGLPADRCLDTSAAVPFRPRRMTENDVEAQREECSSTESTHQEVRCRRWATLCVRCPLTGN